MKLERAVQCSGGVGLAQILASVAGDRGPHLATMKQINQKLGTMAAGLKLSSLPARHTRKHHQLKLQAQSNVVTAVLHLGTWFSDRRSWTCERWCENGTGSVFSGYIWWSIWMRPWAPRRRTCLRGHRRHGHVKEDTTSLACECPAARSYHGMPPVANSLGEDLDPSATAIDL